MARQFNRWSGIPIIGLRFSNIMVRARLRPLPRLLGGPHLRKWNLWGYVDESHVAQSVRLALEADVERRRRRSSSPPRDTVMRTPSRELMAEVFPGVPVADEIEEFGTLLGIDKARRMLGYEAKFTWRELF